MAVGRVGGVLCVALLLAASPPANACFLDLLGICGGAAKIADELDKLPDKVRQAAEQVLDQLFNQDLPPFVDKITAAAEQMLDRGEKDYEKAVNSTRDALTALARSVVNDCEELAKDVTKDVEEIVDTVMKDTIKTVDHIVSEINDDVNQLLTRLETIGKEIFCAASGYIDNFQKEFASYFEKQDCDCVQDMLKNNPGLKQDCTCTSCFHIGGLYPSCRCNPWGLKFAEGWYNRGKYQFAKCHLEKVIDWDHWTVQEIVNQLSIMQEMSLSFRCLEDLQPGSTANRDYFSDEYTNVSHKILVLQNSARPEVRLPAASSPVAKRSAKATFDSGCKGLTIPDCIVQALAELKTAESDFNAAKQEFFDARDALEANMTKLTSVVQLNTAAISNNKDAIDKNTGTISSNAAEIRSNKDGLVSVVSKVGDLSVGLCDCKDWDLQNTYVPDGYVLHDFHYSCSHACSNFHAYGSDDTNGGAMICQPCLGGDGSALEIRKGRQKRSCNPKNTSLSPTSVV